MQLTILLLLWLAAASTAMPAGGGPVSYNAASVRESSHKTSESERARLEGPNDLQRTQTNTAGDYSNAEDDSTQETGYSGTRIIENGSDDSSIVKGSNEPSSLENDDHSGGSSVTESRPDDSPLQNESANANGSEDTEILDDFGGSITENDAGNINQSDDGNDAQSSENMYSYGNGASFDFAAQSIYSDIYKAADDAKDDEFSSSSKGLDDQDTDASDDVVNNEQFDDVTNSPKIDITVEADDLVNRDNSNDADDGKEITSASGTDDNIDAEQFNDGRTADKSESRLDDDAGEVKYNETHEDDASADDNESKTSETSTSRNGSDDIGEFDSDKPDNEGSLAGSVEPNSIQLVHGDDEPEELDSSDDVETKEYAKIADSTNENESEGLETDRGKEDDDVGAHSVEEDGGFSEYNDTEVKHSAEEDDAADQTDTFDELRFSDGTGDVIEPFKDIEGNDDDDTDDGRKMDADTISDDDDTNDSVETNAEEIGEADDTRYHREENDDIIDAETDDAKGSYDSEDRDVQDSSDDDEASHTVEVDDVVESVAAEGFDDVEVVDDSDTTNDDNEANYAEGIDDDHEEISQADDYREVIAETNDAEEIVDVQEVLDVEERDDDSLIDYTQGADGGEGPSTVSETVDNDDDGDDTKTIGDIDESVHVAVSDDLTEQDDVKQVEDYQESTDVDERDDAGEIAQVVKSDFQSEIMDERIGEFDDSKESEESDVQKADDYERTDYVEISDAGESDNDADTDDAEVTNDTNKSFDDDNLNDSTSLENVGDSSDDVQNVDDVEESNVDVSFGTDGLDKFGEISYAEESNDDESSHDAQQQLVPEDFDDIEQKRVDDLTNDDGGENATEPDGIKELYDSEETQLTDNGVPASDDDTEDDGKLSEAKANVFEVDEIAGNNYVSKETNSIETPSNDDEQNVGTALEVTETSLDEEQDASEPLEEDDVEAQEISQIRYTDAAQSNTENREINQLASSDDSNEQESDNASQFRGEDDLGSNNKEEIKTTDAIQILEDAALSWSVNLPSAGGSSDGDDSQRTIDIDDDGFSTSNVDHKENVGDPIGSDANAVTVTDSHDDDNAGKRGDESNNDKLAVSLSSSDDDSVTESSAPGSSDASQTVTTSRSGDYEQEDVSTGVRVNADDPNDDKPSLARGVTTDVIDIVDASSADVSLQSSYN